MLPPSLAALWVPRALRAALPAAAHVRMLGRQSPDYGAVANRGRDLFAGVTPASCDMDSIGVAPASVPASAAAGASPSAHEAAAAACPHCRPRAARCAAPRSLAGGLPPPRFDDALSSVSDRTGPRATSPAAALSFSSPSLPASTPSAALLGLTPASVGFALRRGPDAPSFTASPVQSSAALPLVTAAAASFVTHTPALPDGAVSAMPAGARAWVTHADSSIALDDATPMRTPAMALAFDSAGPAPMSTVRFSAAPASAAPHTAAWTHAVAPAAPPSAAMAAAATDESAAALTSQRERGAGRPPEPPGRLRARRPRRRLLPDSAPPEDTTAPPMTMGDAADGSLSGIDASGSSDTVEAGAEPAAPVLPRDGRERHAESKAGGEDGVRGEGKSAEELQAESEALAWQLMAQENMTMYERMQSALGMLGDAEAMSRLEAEDGDLGASRRSCVSARLHASHRQFCCFSARTASAAGRGAAVAGGASARGARARRGALIAPRPGDRLVTREKGRRRRKGTWTWTA